jgi:hypothetical protein
LAAGDNVDFAENQSCGSDRQPLFWYHRVAALQNPFNLFNGIFDQSPPYIFIWYAIRRATHMEELSPSL